MVPIMSVPNYVPVMAVRSPADYKSGNIVEVDSPI